MKRLKRPRRARFWPWRWRCTACRTRVGSRKARMIARGRGGARRRAMRAHLRYLIREQRSDEPGGAADT